MTVLIGLDPGVGPAMTDAEIWRPVVGHESRYEVSNLGNVRSLDRIIKYSNGVERLHRGRPLKADYFRAGYRRVTLCGPESGRRTTQVHRIVAEAFLGPIPDDHHIDHLDNNPSNNALANLQIVAGGENVNRQIVRDATHQCLVELAKTHCPRGHLLEDPNLRESGKRRGKRQCISCDRARSYIVQHPRTDMEPGEYFQEVSDHYYAKLKQEK